MAPVLRQLELQMVPTGCRTRPYLVFLLHLVHLLRPEGPTAGVEFGGTKFVGAK